MTPLLKWLKKRAAKFADTYEGGPEPPARLREQAIAFANMYPAATRKQFVEMAATLAEEAYRAGYLRGYEWAERDPKAFDLPVPPEVIADQIDPDWRWRPMIDLEVAADEIIPEERSGAEEIRMQLAAFEPRGRRF